MPSFITLTDEAWQQIRYKYECTDQPIADISAEYGISDRTLNNRVRRWGWKQRRTPISRHGPPPVAGLQVQLAPPNAWALGPRLRGDERGEHMPSDPTPTPALPLSGGGSPADAPPDANCPPEIPPYGTGPDFPPRQAHADAHDPGQIVPRLQSAVARVLPAIEATLAKLAAGPMHPRELEQSARALGAMTRTLRELNMLLEQHHAPPAHEPYDDMPEDMDEFRNELARRIRTFVASREAQIPAQYQATWEEFAAQGGAAPPTAGASS